jgi:hypothetical protein
VEFYLWGFNFSDIRVENVKLNQQIPSPISNKTECTYEIDQQLSEQIKTKYASFMDLPGLYENSAQNNILTSKTYFNIFANQTN